MTSTALLQRSNTKAQPGLDWTNLTLGVLLATLTWLALGGDAAIAWNAVVCGAIIVAAACIALSKSDTAAEWANVGLCLWLLIAPWMLGFSANAGAMWTSALVGLGTVCFAGFQIWLLNRSRSA